jgi:mannose-6-phosphate isomerase-like protein (cupin superfamily)
VGRPGRIGALTPTSSLSTGLTELAPGGWLGLHRHTQAEVHHLVEGSGVVVYAFATDAIDDVVHRLSADG